MGTGYVRQSVATIIDSEVINAAPLNNEFNAIKDAFDGTSGHAHDGTSGEGQKISLTAAVSGVLPVANGGTNGLLPTANGGTGVTSSATIADVNADLLDGQHGAYYLPAGSYTAADVLVKLLTVDGAASGLDADLLDGQQGSYYFPAASDALNAKLAGAAFTGAVSTTGTFNATGVITGANSVVSTNGQLVSYGWSGSVTQGIVFLNQAGTRYLHNDGVNYYLPGQQLYINTFLAWTAGNDGSGSGMDTDLVRGVTPGTAGLALLDDTTAAGARTTLELGTMATQAAGSVAITGGTITGATYGGYTSDTIRAFSNHTGTITAAQSTLRPDTLSGIGSYAMAVYAPSPTTVWDTGENAFAGSTLGDPPAIGNRYLSGTWRAMGWVGTLGGNAVHLFQRYA